MCCTRRTSLPKIDNNLVKHTITPPIGYVTRRLSNSRFQCKHALKIFISPFQNRFLRSTIAPSDSPLIIRKSINDFIPTNVCPSTHYSDISRYPKLRPIEISSIHEYFDLFIPKSTSPSPK